MAEEVLARLLEHPYFSLPYPKTTGREVFALSLFQDVLADLSGFDVLATLTALTAESVARAYGPFNVQRVLVAGGGAYNATLMSELRKRLSVPVKSLNVQGATPRDREALCFAALGYYAHLGLPNTLPNVTGARRAVVAGTRTGGFEREEREG